MSHDASVRAWHDGGMKPLPKPYIPPVHSSVLELDENPVGSPRLKKGWEIFRAGTHADTAGIKHTFSEADMAECAASFNLTRYTPPLVKGHPEMDTPAYGRAVHLYAEGPYLYADVELGSAVFAEMDDLKWLAVSAAFYPRDHPHNPCPGKLGIRHIGLLGASPPAVKGLQNIRFAEGDTLQASMAFAELQGWMMASPFEACAEMFRAMREAMIADKGLEQADAVFPNWKIESLLSAATYLRERLDASTTTPSANPIFSEEPTMTEEEIAAMQAENARLKADKAALLKREKDAAEAAVHTGHVAFCEGLVTAGRLQPAEVDNQILVLDTLAQMNPATDAAWIAKQSPQFAEGAVIPSRYETAKKALENRPVNTAMFGEQAGRARAAGCAGTGAVDEHPLVKAAAARRTTK